MALPKQIEEKDRVEMDFGCDVIQRIETVRLEKRFGVRGCFGHFAT